MRAFLASLLLVTASGSIAAPDTAIYDQAVAHAGRSDKDLQRDARDRPAEVMAFAGFKPGMNVADIFAGGGYYSELISYVVGPGGEVLMVNNVPYEDYAKDDIKARFSNEARLPNVTRSVVESCDLQLGTGTLDAATIVMSYHDLFYADPLGGWPKIDEPHFLDQIFKALKPGGTFLIVDHAAKAGAGSSVAFELHRIDEDFAIKDITSHGFVYVGHYDKLRNPDDDRSKTVFDKTIRGKTDRFVHLYRKPAT
jgi:predicted methyltransferase